MRLDRAAGLRDDVLHDREAEAGAPRRARAVGAVEALEQAAELRLADADAVVRAAQDHVVAVALDRERERRSRPGVPDGVLREVLRDDAEHPRPDLELDRAVSLDDERNPCAARPLLQLVRDGLQLRANGDRAERDDARARLELREEQHLVDQLADLPHLAARLLHELGDVLARQHRRLEQREQACERRAELVRDRRGEAGAELLVRRQVAAAAQVDEPLAPPTDVVRDDERDDARIAREEALRDPVTLAQAVDRLPRSTARIEHAVVVVEHDDRLAALLEQHASACGVRVHLCRRLYRSSARPRWAVTGRTAAFTTRLPFVHRSSPPWTTARSHTHGACRGS